jgi:hypothetical protein
LSDDWPPVQNLSHAFKGQLAKKAFFYGLHRGGARTPRQQRDLAENLTLGKVPLFDLFAMLIMGDDPDAAFQNDV